MLSESGTKVVGVLVKGMKIFAPLVISGAGIMNTYLKLLHPSDVKLCHNNDAEDSDDDGIFRNPASDVVEGVQKVLQLNHRTITNTHPVKSEKQSSIQRTLEPSCGMFTVFIGLQGTASESNITATVHLRNCRRICAVI
jgi:hypothetical protein